MKYLSYLLICIPFFFEALSAESVSLNLAATEDEQKEMGLNQLTDAQKNAFESWLGSWTKKVIQASKSYHPALSLNQWVQNWPKYLQPIPPKEDEETLKEEKNELSTLLRNINGKVFILANGSEWKIVDSDRFNTRFWVRETPIEIQENKRDITRPYILFNRSLNDQAGAIKVKEASATPYKEDASYFKDSIQVKNIESGGLVVSLMNNSSWKVAPTDQLIVTTTWKQHDRVKIENSNDITYPYQLNNLDSGSIVQALKKKI